MAVMKDSRLLLLLLLLCCMAMGERVGGVGAPSPAASAADCSSAILSLADCLPYVQEGSKVAKPERSCCAGLKEVVKKDVACLCDAFKQSASFGISLNTTKALGLPGACRVSTPPFSKCQIAVAGVPSAAPAPTTVAPRASPSTAPSTPSVPAPSPGHSSSSAAYFMASSAALLVNVAVGALSCYI